LKVKITKTSGFCMGVQRAMNMVLDAANSGKDAVYTYGPLIHNPDTIELLEKKRVTVLEDIENLSNGTLLIRAHGIPPQLRRKLKVSGARICDATCPKVGGVQSTVKKHMKKGYRPIIVGDAGHPEVVGLVGYSNGTGLVINSEEEVDRLAPLEKVVVVAQTTQDEEKYNLIVNRIKGRFPDVISFNTICESTHLRQQEVRKMAGEVDAVVVVGGKNSGNTRRLAEISGNYGIPTYHVESEKELKPELFRDVSVVGVTGGASTPDWTIRRVVEKLHRIKGHKERSLFRGFENLLRFACFSGMFASLSALGLLLAASVLAGAETSLTIFLVCAFFVFSQQTVFNLSNMERISFINPTRGEFIKRNRLLLRILAGVTCAIALLLSLKLGIAAALTLIFAFALGITYLLNKPHGDRSNEAEKAVIPLNYFKGGEITTSISWSLALGAVPAIASDADFLPSLLAVLGIFLAALLRFILLNTRNLQTDKMLGRMTLPVRLGEKRVKRLIYKLIVMLASLTAVAAAAGVFPAWGYLFAALPFYLLVPFKLRRADTLYPDHRFLASLDAFMLLYLVLALFSFVV